MVMIVIRSKLVLDFALTTHLIHLVVVSLYTGQVPRNLFWWLTMVLSSAVGVALGIWACQYRELRPVFFGGGGGSSAHKNNNNNSSNNNDQHHANGSAGGNGEGSSGGGGGAAEGISPGDEEQGFSRGRGRGRGRDGAGEYEMVKMNGQTAP